MDFTNCAPLCSTNQVVCQKDWVLAGKIISKMTYSMSNAMLNRAVLYYYTVHI